MILFIFVILNGNIYTITMILFIFLKHFSFITIFIFDGYQMVINVKTVTNEKKKKNKSAVTNVFETVWLKMYRMVVCFFYIIETALSHLTFVCVCP